MNWDVWRQVEELLLACEVKPILAIVPDNQNEALRVAEANISFWKEVRAWQARGWTIGLHGYQHLYVTRDAGLLKTNASSEFSGLPRNEQESKIRLALRVFEGENVVPEVWVAPAHSFDTETISALLNAGIRCLSDGFSLYPYVDSQGVLWIPQQLWRFRKMPAGLWTVCLHLNHWTTADIERFRSDLMKFKPMLTDMRSTVARYRNRRRSLMDKLASASWHIAWQGRRCLRRLNPTAIPIAC
jgi:predicted deacetylase